MLNQLATDTSRPSLEDELKYFFGYDEFRPGQEEIIKQVLQGQDCLVLMPTGGGKSLCYQLPATRLPGVTIVISPLIALMKDQVDGLNRQGISAAYVNSSLSTQAINDIFFRLANNQIKLLYVAPERLTDHFFIEGLHHFGFQFSEG